jgi:hypothetical protein
MLKNAEKTEQTSHFTYEEYKKKSNKGANKDVLVFVSVFAVGLIVLLGFAKVLSPNVDVAISVDNEIAAMEEEARAAAIDERLRHIKMEDDGVEVDEEADKMFSPELDEKVVIPNQRKKTVGEIEAEKASKNLSTEDFAKANDSINAFKPLPKEEAEEVVKEIKVQQAQPKVEKPQKPQAAPVSAPVKPSITRVVVGYYASEKQAEVAKSIIQDAGLGITPLVKNIGGYYTLQVGSYSTKEAAQAAANNLLKANFPARIVE